jgi:uncharacterized protein (TIGR02117 family)
MQALIGFFLRYGLRFGAGLLAATLLYFAAALGSFLLPSTGRMQAAEAGAPVYVCDGGFHTDIALPLNDATADLYERIGPALPANLGPDTYLLFGWGDEVFFTSVLKPSDLTLPRALSALFGMNDSVLRVLPVSAASAKQVCLPVAIDADGRKALIDHISASLAKGDLQQRETPVAGETLLLARGNYSPFNTCNQWTSNALGKAGLPRAHFAPFNWSVMGPLRRAERKAAAQND